jgi:hypothetical protein
MEVCLLCLYVVLSCVGRGLYDGLITHPEESYRVEYICDHKNPERGPMFQFRTKGKVKKMKLCLFSTRFSMFQSFSLVSVTANNVGLQHIPLNTIYVVVLDT